MGLFDKKMCSICGEPMGIVTDKKLADGGMCKNCAKKISPFLSNRRQMSVADMNAHLADREKNKVLLRTFTVTGSFGDSKKIYVDAQNRNFLISSGAQNTWATENPDVIPLSCLSQCTFTIEEDADEQYMNNAQGQSVSYNPPRYKYSYDYYIDLRVTHKWFDQIRIKLNTFEVEGTDTAQCQQYLSTGNQICSNLCGFAGIPASQPVLPASMMNGATTYMQNNGYAQNGFVQNGFVQNGFVQQQNGYMQNGVAQNTMYQQNPYAQNNGFMQQNGFVQQQANGFVQQNPYAQQQNMYAQQNGFANPQFGNAQQNFAGQQQAASANWGNQNAQVVQCGNCGWTGANAARFCPNCGTQLM